MDAIAQLTTLYSKLIGGVLCGWLLGQVLPTQVAQKLGWFQYWIGVPLGMVIFLRWADLSGTVWLASLLAWLATFLAAAIAWLWLKRYQLPSAASEGTFMLSVMFGNTGYLGYPIALSLVGEHYFGWVVFYDLLGTTLGAYGLGNLFVRWFSSHAPPVKLSKQILTLLKNPIWWSFGFGLWLRNWEFSAPIEGTLRAVGWLMIMSSLVLIGLRLAQLRSWQHWQPSLVSVGIKMLAVPIILGYILTLFPIAPNLQLTLVLQMAMPPAFATLVVSEAHDLDRELAVTVILMGTTGLLVLLPLWLWWFGG
jgi:hypothetical protein